MSGDEFRDYSKNTHGPLTARIPGLKKYVQNHSLPDSEEGEPPVAGVYFDSVEATQNTLASPKGEAADLPNFTDADKTTTVIVAEVEVA